MEVSVGPSSTRFLLALLCLNLVTTGLAVPPKHERAGNRQGRGIASRSADLQSSDTANQPAAHWRGRRLVAQQPLATTAEVERQSVTACDVGSSWASLCIWRSWMWSWLVGSRPRPTYRWQETGSEESGELVWDDRGSGEGMRKRRLKEITIPHIIHQVCIMA